MFPIVFAHGLEGTPNGAKITALRDAGFQVVAPDGRGLPLAQRIEGLDAATCEGGLILAGSSYGGLAAAWLAAFAIAMGDLAATILVAPPGVTTIGMRVFGLLHSGVDDHVAGLCLTSFAMFSSIAVLALFAGRALTRQTRR